MAEDLKQKFQTGIFEKFSALQDVFKKKGEKPKKKTIIDLNKEDSCCSSSSDSQGNTRSMYLK